MQIDRTPTACYSEFYLCAILGFNLISVIIILKCYKVLIRKLVKIFS
jgi:hypothetical protein